MSQFHDLLEEKKRGDKRGICIYKILSLSIFGCISRVLIKKITIYMKNDGEKCY